MPHLEMYLDGSDLRLVHDELARLGEVAWIAADGPGKWVAKPMPLPTEAGSFTLWHVPSGPLPLLRADVTDRHRDWIEDPWAGWTERRPSSDGAKPYFGPLGGRRTIGIDLWTRLEATDRYPVRLGLSGMGWAGDTWSGSEHEEPAAEATKKWWRALRRFVVANSTKVSRFGPWDTGRLNAYAFPEAMHAIRGGVPRAENPPPWG